METSRSVLCSGFVTVLETMGSDLTIANAARVSMGKRKTAFDEKDAGLVQYLALKEHTTPFRHCAITFHIKAPIFLLRQFMRHNVGISWSEISGRYVDMGDAPLFVPLKFREAAPTVKQGSGGSVAPDIEERAYRIHMRAIDTAREAYRELLELGICKEQARTVLPLGLYSEVYVTMTLQALAHFCRLRLDAHAQLEAQQYAQAMFDLALPHFPMGLRTLVVPG